MRSSICVGLALALLLAAPTAWAVERFDFNTYEFSNDGQDAYGQVPNAVMAERAQAFIAAHYPADSSARLALADFKHAGAACHTVLAPGEIVCSYARPNHDVAALAGSSLWHIELYWKPGTDAVTRITLSRRLLGD